MAWPLRLRAMSFAIIVAVVLTESAVALIPIGAALCIFTHTNIAHVFRILATIAVAFALVIAIHGDLGRQGYRRWWRQRA